MRAVATHGGLAGYLTALEQPLAYIPIEDVIFGVLKSGDIADMAAALAPRPLLMESLVNGRNILAPESLLHQTFDTTLEAYRKSNASAKLALRSAPKDISAWLIAQLQ
ncbi:MAG TPA: hypothetical protein VMZ52_04885 [Bryobacteraceae bacterium]|nr:hypothetical protein [Bryobacteraceae bacterium]